MVCWRSRSASAVLLAQVLNRSLSMARWRADADPHWPGATPRASSSSNASASPSGLSCKDNWCTCRRSCCNSRRSVRMLLLRTSTWARNEICSGNASRPAERKLTSRKLPRRVSTGALPNGLWLRSRYRSALIPARRNSPASSIITLLRRRFSCRRRGICSMP